jgi:aspartate dehydrogenase
VTFISRKSMPKLRVGILGFGALGQHMYEAISSDDAVSCRLEIAFVWNRSLDALESIPTELRCTSLDDVVLRNADIVVEVSHPSVSVKLAVDVMQAGGIFVVGSPTCFSDPEVEKSFRNAASIGDGKGNGALYVPVGALWGAADLQGMANRNSLESVTITMKKHPQMFAFADEKMLKKRTILLEKEKVGEKYPEIVYEGPVRGLCPLAPNNVNTMACCAMAAHTLGFDGTIGRLVADANLTTHEIEIEALGKPNPVTGQQFRMHLTRSSPAPIGAKTSKATYGSFVESLLKCYGRGHGVHFV